MTSMKTSYSYFINMVLYFNVQLVIPQTRVHKVNFDN